MKMTTTAGSFTTIDGIKFVCEHPEGEVYHVWNGGVRGGEVRHYHQATDTVHPFAVEGGMARRGFRNLDDAGRWNIKQIGQRADEARGFLAALRAERLADNANRDLMHTVRSRVALANLYVEDGALHSAARVLQEMADDMKARADERTAALAEIG